MSENELKENEEKTVSEETIVSEESAAAGNTAASSDKKPFKRGFKLEKGTPAYEVFDWLRTICIGV